VYIYLNLQNPVNFFRRVRSFVREICPIEILYRCSKCDKRICLQYFYQRNRETVFYTIASFTTMVYILLLTQYVIMAVLGS